MGYPTVRLRRLRRGDAVRRLVRETDLHPRQLLWPVFVVPGRGVREEVSAMPGVYRLSADVLVEEVGRHAELGLGGLLVFGVPSRKDATASEAYDEEGVVQRAVRALKSALPGLLVATDVCLCAYTDHGHCGVVGDGRILNDPSLELLARTAVSHARAGADMVAPSDMMDGRVGAIRAALDRAGFTETLIMAYSAKYASGFYGPFREAAESAPQFGDRRTYQMDPPNAREALREVALDLEEGADIVMVKPALAYLDVIRRVREAFDCPVAAYSVSGEYSMIRAAAARGWLDERRIALEVATAIRRAGADIVITYYAPLLARWLKEDGAC
ncbi:MAG: porphobilinogen synthase [Firmicutes bacterium]|nr:porphobilinogen synthase [Bacillota bacterium]